jgi:YHS domain-containing protein
MKKLGLTIAMIFVSAQILSANHYTELKQTRVVTDTLKADGIDPVCKMKIKAGNTKTVVFNKVTYGFCSESCKKTFVADPKKYIKK